jgi:chorismate lyase/3-hydroxybenzoate synthase
MPHKQVIGASLNRGRQVDMESNITQFGLAYLSADEVEKYLEEHRGKVLGMVGFGQEIQLQNFDSKPLWVDIPVLGGNGTSFEVWTSDVSVVSCESKEVSGRCDDKLLFASLTLLQTEGKTLQMLAEQAYTRIFEFIDLHGYPNLLRVWHYFPQINDDENGLERYRGFNVGRHAAFEAARRKIGEADAPAASVLGSNSGSLTIYFMAGVQPGKAVENPRQVSAYNYPQVFGPRSPIFVRAMSANLGGQYCFFISGTASIVGYETLHQGDAEKQTDETLQNIRALLQQIPHYDSRQGRMLLKVYLRHIEDLPMLQAKVKSEFGAGCKAVYLHSNICRADLLLEIEAAYFHDM